MDQQLIPLDPNLKFVSELKEDLKTKYFELHGKAKETLEAFLSTSLQNIYLQHHKLLAENIELHITIESLKQVIKKRENCQGHISPLNNPSSEILGSSPNCSLRNLSRKSNIDGKKEETNCDNVKYGQLIEKENVNKYVEINSADFLSDKEDSFVNQKSPVKSVVSTSMKEQNSPVFNKRKRSKKSNSLISNNSSHSITSSNDSKISPTNTVNNGSTFEKNIVDIDSESDKEVEKGLNKEPLKTIDNTYSSFTPTRQLSNKEYKLLSVSKSSYGKTDFSEKGKRLRQTTLTLKKTTPLIDISKDNDITNCSINDSKSNVDFIWSKSFSNKEKTNKNINTKEYDISKKPLKTKAESKNYSFKTNNKDETTSIADDDLVETSPAYNEKSKSKLRNKLSLSKKAESQFKESTQCMIIERENPFDSENITKKNSPKHNRGNVISNPKTQDKMSNLFSRNEQNSEERRLFEPQRTLSDDTYFSLAEQTSNKNDLTDCDMSDFEDGGKQETPPAKRMLLSSFDIIPGRKEKSPDYAYKEGPVRKKNERAQLRGWDCRDCKPWYGNLSEEERKKKQNLCSRHRGKYKADVNTPESFWNPVFEDDSNDSSADDY